jgi:GT2 family glycosyltransferase
MPNPESHSPNCPDISIVIPTWKGRRLLEAYLPSVLSAAEQYRNQTRAQTEIIVVEDGSGDDTIQWLKGRYTGKVSVIEHSRNLGFSAACNSGFRAASHPVALLLNNDVRLREDCIEPMIAHFVDRQVFAVTGKIFNQKGDQFCNGGKIGRFRRGMWSSFQNYDLMAGVNPDLPLLSFTAIGAFSAYDRAKFLEVGGFEPLTSLVEDIDLSYRGWKRGWYILYEPRSVAFHDASQTMSARYEKKSLDSLSRRSRFLMHWMLLHDPTMFRRHLLALAGRLLVSWLVLDWRFYVGIFSGLSHLGHILETRRVTRRTMVRCDRELLDLLERFYRTAPITLIDDLRLTIDD